MKILKYLLLTLLLILAGTGLLFIVYNEPLPQGQQGVEADALALKMLKALDYEAYKNTRFLTWSFAAGKHRYAWDKEQDTVRVQWAEYDVQLNLENPGKSTVLKENTALQGPKKTEIVQQAQRYFNNDSFWLVAPYKVFDLGTERRLVPRGDGAVDLLVTYTMGGDTPGDSYLWELDSKAIPIAFKMWVKIIPIGGLRATWDSWQTMASGAKLPTAHQMGPVTLEMGNVKATN